MSVQILSEIKKKEVAEACVHHNLKRSVRSVTQQFDAALAEKGLHITQFTLLVTSSLLGSAPVSELAERLSVDRTTLTRNLEPLKTKYLIKTSTSEVDARVRLVEITAKGEAVLAESYPLWKGVQNALVQGFDTEAYTAFLTRLEQLSDKS